MRAIRLSIIDYELIAQLAIRLSIMIMSFWLAPEADRLSITDYEVAVLVQNFTNRARERVYGANTKASGPSRIPIQHARMHVARAYFPNLCMYILGPCGDIAAIAIPYCEGKDCEQVRKLKKVVTAYKELAEANAPFMHSMATRECLDRAITRGYLRRARASRHAASRKL